MREWVVTRSMLLTTMLGGPYASPSGSLILCSYQRPPSSSVSASSKTDTTESNSPMTTQCMAASMSASAPVSVAFAPTCLLSSGSFIPAAVDTPVLSCRTSSRIEHFMAALEQFVFHPERHSSQILRHDVLSDSHDDDPSDRPSPSFSSTAPPIDEFTAFRSIRRRLLPKSKRDGPLDQFCTFFNRRLPSSSNSALALASVEEEVIEEDVVLELRCLGVSRPADIPFYHPAVSAIRFWYSSEVRDKDGGSARLSISVELLEPEQLSEESRLYRTCLRLLETLWKHSRGSADGYQKRVNHDVSCADEIMLVARSLTASAALASGKIIVQRDAFQDLYRELKEKYSALVSRVGSDGHEVKEDVKRCV